jgi:hypothetical protein
MLCMPGNGKLLAPKCCKHYIIRNTENTWGKHFFAATESSYDPKLVVHISDLWSVCLTHTSVLIIDSRWLVRGLRWYLVDPLAWNPNGSETKSAREKEHLAVAFWVQVAHTVVYGVWLHLWLVTTVSDKSLKVVSAEMYFLYFHFLLVVDLWHLWTTHDYAMSH